MGFEASSYERHAEHFANDLVDPERIAISGSWFDDSTADYWRHARMYECADCILDKSASWLTVGDGRWGLDSIRLRKRGITNVLATDISEPLLKAAKDRGLLSEYSVENAERLSFADRSFDYVLCKESFHHFPRPYVALYEMMRVARKAVFLIEPNDLSPVFRTPAPLGIKASLRSLLVAIRNRLRGSTAKTQLAQPPKLDPINPQINPPVWEDSGNYVYQMSRREAEKIALGLNLPQLVIKGLNDCWIKGCEFEKADKSSAIFREITETIERFDRGCREGRGDYCLLMLGFIISPMGPAEREEFAKREWSLIDLPRNPYA
jgi:SAM-dependent methyltransferase